MAARRFSEVKLRNEAKFGNEKRRAELERMKAEAVARKLCHIQHQMSEKLFHIPLVRWVRGTIERVNESGKDQFPEWSKCWVETYNDLGGQRTSGSKNCPQRAAHCLWYLGRVVDGGRGLLKRPLEFVNNELGPNAAYAFLAMAILDEEHHDGGSTRDWSTDELWSKVRARYRQELRKEPSRSEQGAIRVALGLFTAGQIVPPSR